MFPTKYCLSDQKHEIWGCYTVSSNILLNHVYTLHLSAYQKYILDYDLKDFMQPQIGSFTDNNCTSLSSTLVVELGGRERVGGAAQFWGVAQSWAFCRVMIWCFLLFSSFLLGSWFCVCLLLWGCCNIWSCH